jgi:hypothetical protein
VTLLPALFVGIVLSVVWGSFFEWTLHRFVMHRRVPFFGYPFRTHAVIHHGTFGPGPDYHLLQETHRELVTMAWWNGPALLAANSPAALGVVALVGSWWAGLAFMATLSLYYAAYEYLHWCMHVPGPRWFQATGLFRWLDRHHRLHHLQPGHNLNVVIPLADWILRTRLARAPMQAPPPAP